MRKFTRFFQSKMSNCVKWFFHFVVNPFHYSVYLENVNVVYFNITYNLSIWSFAHQPWMWSQLDLLNINFYSLSYFLSGKPNALNSMQGVRKCFFLFRRNRVSLQAGADIIRKGNPGIKINQALILRCDTVRRRKLRDMKTTVKFKLWFETWQLCIVQRTIS